MQLHDNEVQVYSIGVTSSIDRLELASLSSPPHLKEENWFTTPNFDALSSIVDLLTERTCGIYIYSKSLHQKDNIVNVLNQIYHQLPRYKEIS